MTTEERMIDEHLKELQKIPNGGNANVGWASGDDFICSKIYGENPKVLTTEIKKGEFVHTIEPYKKLWQN